MAHILAVDDDIAMLQLVRRVLEKDQHLVTLQSNAKAVTEMDFSKFGLILLDVMMPEIDGFDLCNQIRDRVDCPIIFLTAKTQESEIVQGLGLGADDYITKTTNICAIISPLCPSLYIPLEITSFSWPYSHSKDIYITVAPKGISASFAILKHCTPKGIPIIVQHKSNPFSSATNAKGIPLISSHKQTNLERG